MPINDPEKSENMRKSIRVYSGSSNRPLAQKIAEYLGVELSGLTLKQFANGEIYARYVQILTFKHFFKYLSMELFQELTKNWFKNSLLRDIH